MPLESAVSGGKYENKLLRIKLTGRNVLFQSCRQVHSGVVGIGVWHLNHGPVWVVWKRENDTWPCLRE